MNGFVVGISRVYHGYIKFHLWGIKYIKSPHSYYCFKNKEQVVTEGHDKVIYENITKIDVPDVPNPVVSYTPDLPVIYQRPTTTLEMIENER